MRPHVRLAGASLCLWVGSCALAARVDSFEFSDVVGDWVSTSSDVAGTMTLRGDGSGDVAVHIAIGSLGPGYREYTARWVEVPPVPTYTVTLECRVGCGALDATLSLSCTAIDDAAALDCGLLQGATEAARVVLVRAD